MTTPAETPRKLHVGLCALAVLAGCAVMIGLGVLIDRMDRQ